MANALPSEKKPTNCRALYETLTDYIDSNRYSRDTTERWLCSNLEPLLKTLSSVMSSRLSEPDKKAVAAFRAAEIAAEIATKRKEIERLERDLKTTAL
jgi:hypothetical protein